MTLATREDIKELLRQAVAIETSVIPGDLNDIVRDSQSTHAPAVIVF